MRVHPPRQKSLHIHPAETTPCFFLKPVRLHKRRTERSRPVSRSLDDVNFAEEQLMKLLITALAATALIFGSVAAGHAKAGGNGHAGAKAHVGKTHVSAKSRVSARSNAPGQQ